MKNLRFGLKKLNEKANIEVRLKSKFGLKPVKGCEIDFSLSPLSQEIHLQAIHLTLDPLYQGINVEYCSNGTPIEGTIIYLENQNNPSNNETATTGPDGWAYFSILTYGEIYNGTVTLPDNPDVTINFVLDMYLETLSPDTITIPQKIEISVDGEICEKDIEWIIDNPSGGYITATIISKNNEKIVIEINCPGFSGPCYSLY